MAADNFDAKVPVCTKGACLAEEDELGLIGGRHFIRILNRLVNDKAFGMAEMCFVKSDYRVLYVDEHIASYRLEEQSYVGGAHGSTTVRVGTLVAGRKDAPPGAFRHHEGGAASADDCADSGGALQALWLEKRCGVGVPPR